MDHQLLNFLNLVLCTVWGGSAVFRVGVMTNAVMLRYAVLYVGCMVAAFLCGFQFFIFGTLAGWADVIASCVVLALMMIGGSRWREGPPLDTLSGEL